MRKKIITLVAVALFMLLFVGCGRQTIDISEYVSVTYRGLDGKATAVVKMDLVELEAALWNPGEGEFNNLQTLAFIEDSIECSADKTENLSNGDKITVTISYDEEIVKKAKYKFTGVKKEIIVSGLEEGMEIDLFADISILCSGVSPDATAEVVNTSKDSWISGIRYSLEKSTGVANGDKIKVTANCSMEQAENNGYIIGETEKVYTIEGIDEYISSYAAIDEETLNKADAQAQDLIESKLVSEYWYGKTLYPNTTIWKIQVSDWSMEHVYTYFSTIKEGVEEWNKRYNSTFLVYKVIGIDDRTPEGKEAYVAVRLNNYILRDDGSVDVVVTDAQMYGSYESYDDMYRDIVIGNKDKFIFEEIVIE